MRKMIVLYLIFLLWGCSYGTEKLKTLVTDPHYAGHQKDLDELEKSYLDGKLTYPQYLDKKKQLEDGYAKEVQTREEIIHPQ